MRVFAPAAFRFAGVDYPYGWQDMSDNLANTLNDQALVFLDEPIQPTPNFLAFAKHAGIVTAQTNPLTGGNDFSGGTSTLKLPAGITDLSAGVGGGAVKPYLGIVASHCRFANTTSGTNKQSMSRVKHIAMDSLQSVQLVYTNVQLILTTETNPSAATSITSSIEYPVGTLTQVTFNGLAQGEIPIGGTIVSDVVKLPSALARGVPFYTRTWQNAAGGMLFNATMGSNALTSASNASGEFMTYGVTTADLTMSASVPNNGLSAYSLYGPQAIIGTTTRPTFALCGDSRTQGSRSGGNGEYLPNQFGATGYVERAIGKKYGVMPLGLGSETAAQAAGSNYVARANFLQYCSSVICEYGINDVNASTPAATILASLATFAGKFSGKPVYVCTMEPISTSTDSWATTANQTTHANNAIRTAVNNSIRSGLAAPFSGYVEIADVFESTRDSGLWKAATRTASDLSMTAATKTLTSTANFQFTTNDIGNAVLVAGAGAAGATLLTWITGVTNSTTATCSHSASTTVGPTATGVMPYTSDGTHASRFGNVIVEFGNDFDVVAGSVA